MNLPPLPPQVQDVGDKLLHPYADIPLPGGLYFSPNLLQAILVVFLIFLLIMTFASLRHRYLGWHIKGILPGLSFGFALALILEGFLLIGGKTVLTEVLGWKNAPKPISTALDTGRSKLVDVLGVTAPIPESNACTLASASSLTQAYSQLTKKEQDQAKASICK